MNTHSAASEIPVFDAMSFVERMVKTLSPDEDIDPCLLLKTPKGWTHQMLSPEMFDVRDVEASLSAELPPLVRRWDASQVLFCVPVWGVAYPSGCPVGRAVADHLSTGGRIVDLSDRWEAIACLVVGRDHPPVAVVARLERDPHGAPTLGGWFIENGFDPELVAALNEAVGRGQVDPPEITV